MPGVALNWNLDNHRGKYCLCRYASLDPVGWISQSTRRGKGEEDFKFNSCLLNNFLIC